LLATVAGCDSVDLRTVTFQDDALQLFTPRLARSTRILPLYMEGDRLVAAQYDPLDIRSVDRARRACRRDIRIVAAPRTQLLRYAELRFGSEEEEVVDKFIKRSAAEVAALQSMKPHRERGLFFRDLEEEVGSPPVERLLEAIVAHAVKRRATDIHITCHPDRIELRHRIDGALREGKRVPKELHAALVSRVKLSGGMDISRHNLPQDGNFQVGVEGRNVQIRVGNFPTIYGEDVALRLLYSEMYLRDLSSLGFNDHALPGYTQLLDSPKGMILVTGPVGVGKTTTLYSSLSRLIHQRRRIITLEDPVECRIEGITQSQVSPDTGYDFAAGLRSILRMDPNVIMVGEIRDVETARMALRASLTGMLVLSTLHTDHAAGAIPRLLDMEIEPFLLTSSLLGVLSQALMRTICDECKQKVEPNMALVRQHKLPESVLNGEFYRGTGCERCENTGYYGRTGIFELLLVEDTMRNAIKTNADTTQVERIAREAGMETMFDDAMTKVHAGVTTLDEAVRALSGRE